MTKQKVITEDRYENIDLSDPPEAEEPLPKITFRQRYSKAVSDSLSLTKSAHRDIVSGNDSGCRSLQLLPCSGCPLPSQQVGRDSPCEPNVDSFQYPWPISSLKKTCRYGFNLPLPTESSNSGTCRINTGFKVDCLPEKSSSYIRTLTGQRDCEGRGCCYDNSTG